jgi:hypothetical protein
MYFPASIKDGQLSFNHIHLPPRFTKWAREHEGASLSVGVDKPKRTVTQNSYYWCYLGIVEQETGQLATDVHEWPSESFSRRGLSPSTAKKSGYASSSHGRTGRSTAITAAGYEPKTRLADQGRGLCIRVRRGLEDGRKQGIAVEQSRRRQVEWAKLFAYQVAASVIGCGIILAAAIGLTNLPH